MIIYIIRRLLWAIPVLFFVILVTFLMARAIPGGPFDRAGDKVLPDTVRANLEARYGLNDPLPVQFSKYVGGIILRGDLGPSYHYRGRTVNEIIAQTLPISAQLGLLSLLLGLIIGLPMGIFAALKQNTWIDYTSSFIAIVGLSINNIVLGPLLIFFFSVQLGWFPAARWAVNYKELYFGIFPPLTSDFWSHAVLPVITLGTGVSAAFARLGRASLLQTIREDYIRTARSKGLSQYITVVRHALKNSMIPVVTIIGPVFAALVTGTFVVERIFGIAGMGEFLVTSIGNRDYTVILGTTLVYSVMLIIANIFVDITYAWLDPRIRYE